MCALHFARCAECSSTPTQPVHMQALHLAQCAECPSTRTQPLHMQAARKQAGMLCHTLEVAPSRPGLLHSTPQAMVKCAARGGKAKKGTKAVCTECSV